LLLRFYDPQQGRIELLGNDIKALSLNDVRSRMALVPQQPVLFSKDVWYNIRYGRPDASDEQVIAAAKAAYAYDFIMELPSYKVPKLKNVALTIYEKSLTFVVEAGKVIIAISILLWVLASYGTGDDFNNAEEIVAEKIASGSIQQSYDVALSAYKLEHSIAGTFGKFIEPAIRPLGYDWKIGIALITSFAAREVFVGTISTIYSIGASEDDELTIKERLSEEKNPWTGGKMYTPALGYSLMVFYAFAMQCMSTLAVVYRETKGWKWPIIQTLYMSAFAYLAAWLTYTLFS